MMKNTETKLQGVYSAPEISTVSVQTEKGFAQSEAAINDMNYELIDNWN